jgi:D-amino-acid dehydrogenase
MGDQKTVAIVGAGIVGVSTAIWLQRAGVNVILIDRAGPGEGTSYGNAGILASSSIVPVTVPGLLRKAPGMLLSRDQPLFLKWGYLPRLMPWLIKYLRNANAADATRIAGALYGVLGDSLADHQALADGTRADRYIHATDYMYGYGSRAGYEADKFTWDLRRKYGFEWGEIDDFPSFDPAFSPKIGFAINMLNHGMIRSPGDYVKALAAHAEAQGAKMIKADVTDVVREGARVTGVRASGETIYCDAMVLATGVWSKALSAKLGMSVPLEAERGYHVEIWEPNITPKHPIMIASGKFVVTPMEGRLRMAGVVEFGGLDAPPSEAPFQLLKRQAMAAMPGLEWKNEERWMGHRPAPTDSIPLIGAVPGVEGAFMGFGHQHVGLTGGPKTGRMLAQLITGQKTNMDMTPYDPARFGG